MIERLFITEETCHDCRCVSDMGQSSSQCRHQKTDTLYFDVESRLIHFGGMSDILSYFQAEALWVLLSNCDDLVEIGTLMNALYGGREEQDVKTLRKHIRTLNKRLYYIGVHNLIKKVSSRGYIASAHVLSYETAELGV